MIQLPFELEPAFLQAVHAIEEDKKMPCINTAERHGIEKGFQQGRQETQRETTSRMIMQTEMDDALIAIKHSSIWFHSLNNASKLLASSTFSSQISN